LFVELPCFFAGSCNGFSGHVQNTSSLKYIASSNNTNLASVSIFADPRIISLPRGCHTYCGLQKWSLMFVNDAKYGFICECNERRVTETVWVDKRHIITTKVSISKFAELLLDLVAGLRDSHVLCQSLFSFLWM
jgi:hypothetical protein